MFCMAEYIPRSTTTSANNHCNTQSDVMSCHGHRKSQLGMLQYFTHVLYFSQQLGLDRREVIRWNRQNGRAISRPLNGAITNAQNPDLKKVSHCPFSKNQHVSVPSNTPITIKEISGCSINSRTWISMWNFAGKLTAELVPFRLSAWWSV